MTERRALEKRLEELEREFIMTTELGALMDPDGETAENIAAEANDIVATLNHLDRDGGNNRAGAIAAAKAKRS